MATEPQALVFPGCTPTRVQMKQSAKEPRAVSFAELPPLPSSTGPGQPVLFQPSAPVRAIAVPGIPDHPLLSTLLAQGARDATPGSVDPTELRRQLAQLLPVTLERIENFALRPLEQCREYALTVAQANLTYSSLGVAAAFDKVSQQLRPGLSTGVNVPAFAQSLLSKLRPTAGPRATVQALQTLRAAIATFLSETRATQVKFTEAHARLRVAAHALQTLAATQVCSAKPDLERALDRRCYLMDSALSQARLVAAQITNQENIASAHLMECDQILSVAVSAVALHQQIPSAH